MERKPEGGKFRGKLRMRQVDSLVDYLKRVGWRRWRRVIDEQKE